MQQERERMRRAGKRRRTAGKMWAVVWLTFFCIAILFVTGWEIARFHRGRKASPVMQEADPPQEEKAAVPQPEFDIQLLSVNEYSRPGSPLAQVKGIVVHYTANPGTGAQQNRDYFEGLAVSGETYASSHFVIGIEGEMIQCVPCEEISYASNERNADTISIECCISDERGKFSEATYASLVHLTAWLMDRYGLTIADVIRHYDVTGKACPKYFVDYPLEWEQFKIDVCNFMEG